MDLMSRAVDEMRVRRAIYRRETLTSLRKTSHAEGERAVYVMLEGAAVLHQHGRAWTVSAGDLVLLPQRSAHTLKNARPSNGDEPTELLWGFVEFDAPDHPLFNVLPSVVHATPAQFGGNPRYAAYLEALKQEALNTRDGSDALQARLTEVLLIEIMRLFTPPPGVECPVGGWFSGLRDPAVRRALVAIHEDPDKAWTVAALAKVGRTSRSAFAAHFAKVMRESPMAYLARWRMYRGRSLLRQTELPLELVAERVGYGSAAAFSLAFVRAHGVSPGNYRRTERAKLNQD